MKFTAKCLIAASAVLAFQGQTWSQWREWRDGGRVEYLSSCAACHGNDGKGGGPVASQLKVAAPNLTQLAKKNGGVFPLYSVYEKIDGRQEVKAHGSRDMPIWGYRYSPWPKMPPDQAFDPKSVLSKPPGILEVPSADLAYDPEVLIRARVLALIDYLYRIQEK